MRLKFVAAAVLLCLAAAAHAQVAAYLTYSPGDFLFFDGNGSRDPNNLVNGGSAGVTIDHIHEGRFLTAVDARGSFHTKTHIQSESAAIDYRAAFVPTKIWLRPFIQLGVGFVSVHDPNNSAFLVTPSTTNATLDLSFGVDLRITQSVDLRLLDIDASAPFKVGTAAAPSVGAGSLNMGVVYHFSTP